MIIRACFVGKNGSMGFKTGQVYDLEVIRNDIRTPKYVPYETVEAFLRNWLPIATNTR